MERDITITICPSCLDTCAGTYCWKCGTRNKNLALIIQTEQKEIIRVIFKDAKDTPKP